MFRFGYCSECTAHIALDQLEAHGNARHPGLVVWANLFQPDPPGTASKLEDAIQALQRVARTGEDEVDFSEERRLNPQMGETPAN